MIDEGLDSEWVDGDGTGHKSMCLWYDSSGNGKSLRRISAQSNMVKVRAPSRVVSTSDHQSGFSETECGENPDINELSGTDEHTAEQAHDDSIFDVEDIWLQIADMESDPGYTIPPPPRPRPSGPRPMPDKLPSLLPPEMENYKPALPHREPHHGKNKTGLVRNGSSHQAVHVQRSTSTTKRPAAQARILTLQAFGPPRGRRSSTATKRHK
ncbi:uncharacterized protein JN550_002244 [Neoarthrinium moseri]|uniref:uncharacterized protein n=1 Tax=Neoarthrinium moseri TaxID=1658444 RepID=UPI001FDCA0A0|nr:uncharacterized protein JN550_002244 [Neoarthrinium moseri]KAI1874815.1 hypothetical protein JN550_002244 [Neoarthrinium moseri]